LQTLNKYKMVDAIIVRGVTYCIRSSTFVVCAYSGVYQGLVLDVCCVSGELPRASILKRVNVTP
jgi:hypothetical protein